MLFSDLDDKARSELKTFYRQFMPYARLHKKEHVWVIRDEALIIASARVRPIGQLSLLTGMLVHPDYRQQGLANRLINELKPELKQESTFLFSLPHLTLFYQNQGFKLTDTAPNDILQLFNKYQNQGKQLVLMVFDVSPSPG